MNDLTHKLMHLLKFIEMSSKSSYRNHISIYFVILSSLGMVINGELFAQSIAKSSEKNYQALLWEISGNEIDKPSYLFGTMHIIPQDSFFVPQQYQAATETASRLIIEVVLDGKAIMQTAMGMFLKPPASLQTLLGEDDYSYLQSFMNDSMKAPIPMYQMYKPIYLTQQISVGYCMDEMPTSYEMSLMSEFKKADKPISGLETVEQQMAVLDEMSIEEQITGLLEAIQNPNKSCSQLSQLIELYRRQDLDGLLTLSAQDPEIEEHLGSLLYERNQNWVPQLEEYIKKESVFIAVGAGHLPGEEGVINLLRNKGYTVKALE